MRSGTVKEVENFRKDQVKELSIKSKVKPYQGYKLFEPALFGMKVGADDPESPVR